MPSHAEVLDLWDLVDFNWEKFTKVDLFASDRLLLGLNCFEAGQVQPAHSHQGQDKFYVVLRGIGMFSLAGERQAVAEGGCVWAPAGVEHGVSNETGERLVLLVGMAPSPSTG